MRYLSVSTSGDAQYIVFKILRSPGKRRILESLAEGRKYVRQLIAEVRVTADVVGRHLRELESWGLIRRYPGIFCGRYVVWNELTEAGLTVVELIRRLSSPSPVVGTQYAYEVISHA